MLHNWSEEKVKPDENSTRNSIQQPNWVGQNAPVGLKATKTISPSSLPGDKVVPGGDGTDPETALRKGRQVHLLLEHLSKTDPSQWSAKAEQLLVGDCLPVDSVEFKGVLAEAVSVLEDPDLAIVFADDVLAEVGVSAEIAELGGQRLDGIIDRLIITPDRVLVVDFKTNSAVPERAEDVPVRNTGATWRVSRGAGSDVSGQGCGCGRFVDSHARVDGGSQHAGHARAEHDIVMVLLQ